MAKYKAVIFDFDLTLADSSKGILICFKHTLSAFGYPVPDDKTIYDTIGMTLADAFDLLTGVENNPEREQMRREYVKKADSEMVKNTFFYEGVVNALSELRNSGVRVGICSTKFRYRIEDSFVRQAGCKPYDVIVGGEDVLNAKPHPEGLDLCIEKLGVEKSDLLYVGDHTIDALTALKAGVDFAAVLTGSIGREEFERYNNVGIFSNAVDLICNVDKL